MLVGEIGEEKLLNEIRGVFAVTNATLPVPIGDDAAVIDFPPDSQQVWTSDLMVEGIHFRRDWQSPKQLGAKSLAVNLSDLAAMAAEPECALLSMSFEASCDVDEILGICRGFCETALEFGVAVAGGDLSGSHHGMTISVAAGGVVESGTALLRSGAGPGDRIFVTGNLGSAAAGMRLLASGGKADEAAARLTGAFLKPEPRCKAGLAMARAGATAMTDISDGLAADLRHICQASGVGAQLESGSIPVDPVMVKTARANGWDAMDLAMCGGEDYELLFTADEAVSGGAISRFSRESGLAVTAIGRINDADAGLTMSAAGGAVEDLWRCGFDHFGSGNER